METKSTQKVSDFHKYIETCIQHDFGDIKFENGKAIVMAVVDETDKGYVCTKGSRDDVTLAVCELFHTVSKKDSALFCEIFAEMLSHENAGNLYNSIRQRADFDSFHEEYDSDDKDEIKFRYIGAAELEFLLGTGEQK